MKGIILAGGAGSRLWPITLGISKQLLPIYDKPMIYYPLSVLMLAKIQDILIITTPEDQASFKKLLGDGMRFGLNLEYAVQEHPNGLAEAFIIGEDFIGDDSVCLVLGDNIFHGSGFEEKLKKARSIAESDYNSRAVIFGYEVSDPHRYGVANVIPQKNDKKLYDVLKLVEKPEFPESNVAVTGLYFYPNSVISIAKQIKPSARNELEITEVNRAYNNMISDDGYKMLDLILLDTGFAWLDTGTFESLSEASGYVEAIENRQGTQIACLEEIGYKNGWITDEMMERNISEFCGNNKYKKHLESFVNYSRARE